MARRVWRMVEGLRDHCQTLNHLMSERDEGLCVLHTLTAYVDAFVALLRQAEQIVDMDRAVALVVYDRSDSRDRQIYSRQL